MKALSSSIITFPTVVAAIMILFKLKLSRVTSSIELIVEEEVVVADDDNDPSLLDEADAADEDALLI